MGTQIGKASMESIIQLIVVHIVWTLLNAIFLSQIFSSPI